MEQLPSSITLTIALLTVYLSFVVVLKYAVPNHFLRTRALMTSFFFFIVATLTLSFWHYTFATLPFTAPSFLFGALLGHVVGVRAAERRLSAEGKAHYMQHFADLRLGNLNHIPWWNLINFYSVMSALVLINMVGFSTVIIRQNLPLVIGTSAVGALLLGSIAPYLVHLWAIKAPHHTSNTASER